MSSSLTPTFGMWLVSVYLESIFYGAGMLQVYLYFTWYPTDNFRIKASVILLAVVETLQLACFFRSTNYHLVESFGDFEALLEITSFDLIQLVCIYLSAGIVQLYFAYCIYMLIGMSNKKKWIRAISGLIVVLVMLELGAGFAQVAQCHQIKTFVKLSGAKDMTSLQSATALAVDLIITITLVTVLDHSRSGHEKTNNMVNTLIVYAINRGILTAIAALINLILFLAIPGTFYFFIGLVISSKCSYMNSMLATLNSRSHIRTKSDTKGSRSDGVNWNSMLHSVNQRPGTSLTVLNAKAASSDATAFELDSMKGNRGLQVHVQSQTLNDKGEYLV